MYCLWSPSNHRCYMGGRGIVTAASFTLRHTSLLFCALPSLTVAVTRPSIFHVLRDFFFLFSWRGLRCCLKPPCLTVRGKVLFPRSMGQEEGLFRKVTCHVSSLPNQRRLGIAWEIGKVALSYQLLGWVVRRVGWKGGKENWITSWLEERVVGLSNRALLPVRE